MPTDKSLPDTENDIIDLTDLVEAEGAGGGSSGSDAPVDMSFEQELDDLFGDVEPEPAKAAAPSSADVDDDEDLIDLAGLELADADTPAPPPQAPAAAADDDAIDLASLGFDEAEAEAPAAAVTRADDKDLDALLGEGGDAAKDVPGKVSADDAALADLFGGTEAVTPAAAETAAADMAFEGLEQEIAASEAPLPQTAAGDEAVDVSEMNLSEFVPEAEAGETEIRMDDAMAHALGELPPSSGAMPSGEEPDVETAGTFEPAFPETVPAPDLPASTEQAVAAVAAGAMTMAAMTATAVAGGSPTPTVAGIDLGALDHLIDTAKGPLPEPEPEEPAASEALAALTARLEALETATAVLAEKCDALPPVPDEQSLATAVAARLEETLTGRFEALLRSQPVPDLEALRNEFRAEIETAKPDHEALLADLQTALAPQFESLRQDFPQIGELAQKSELTGALVELRESLTRLEALTQGRQTQFDDFADAMEARLAELRKELPEPGSFVSAKQLGAALADVCDTLTGDFTAKLDDRLAAVAETARQAAGEEVHALGETLSGRLAALETDRVDPDTLADQVRETLLGDVATRLEDRLAAVAETARQAAREETQALGEALSGRFDTLETDRIDPDALAERVRETLMGDIAARLDDRLTAVTETASQAEQVASDAQARLEAKPDRHDLDQALATLRSEMTAEMERAVPRAAAAVIREEIASLAKDFL